MQTTIVNLLAVIIVGNLALLVAWAAGGIAWHIVKIVKEGVRP